MSINDKTDKDAHLVKNEEFQGNSFEGETNNQNIERKMSLDIEVAVPHNPRKEIYENQETFWSQLEPANKVIYIMTLTCCFMLLCLLFYSFFIKG